MKKKKQIIVLLTVISFILIIMAGMIGIPKIEAFTKQKEQSQKTDGNIYIAWNKKDVYVSGDRVLHNSKLYQARWWTKGENPEEAQVWGIVEDEKKGTLSWDKKEIYIGGRIVSYNGATYKAKWWTLGEIPGKALVWEQITGKNVETEEDKHIETAAKKEEAEKKKTEKKETEKKEEKKTEADKKQSKKEQDKKKTNKTDEKKNDKNPKKVKEKKEVALNQTFKVVGYYPSWVPDKIDNIQYDKLTHINYAFAIPTREGELRPLDNPDAARSIITRAHKEGVKVLLAVGGWSYNGIPLEATFMEATKEKARIEKLGDAIVSMAKEYGFDGIDMDWEHPRADGSSKQQYEDLMVYLSKKLKKENMLLTSAVLSGVTPDGVIYWDSAAHTDKIIEAVDWFNVMAYDGGDGGKHSGYEFSISCGEYWRDTRKMPREKVVLGVPFYGRPSWASYSDIIAVNPNAHTTDTSTINGMDAHYNGVETMQKKTQWAYDNIGGIMIWELSQDTTDSEKSLLNAIDEKIKENITKKN